MEAVATAPEAGERGSLGPGTISACVVAHNEEAVIERCLRSLDGVVDEIIFIHDGECADRTLELAEAHGARVLVRPRAGYAEWNKTYAFELARGDWLLVIDADEFLSEPLRRELRGLAAREEVNGYLLQWPLWNGRRYFTEGGPYRLAMFRRDHVRWVGIVHAMVEVDPPVEHVDLQIEHRPSYNNWSLRSVLTKWRPRARVAAGQYLMDLADIPHFGWKQAPAWPSRRKLLNRLSPLIFLPYAVAAFALLVYRDLFRYGNRYGPWTNLRLAFYEGVYAGMLQLYVARYQYLGRG